MSFQKTSHVPMEKVTVEDPFWSQFMERVRTKLIPYQWRALNDAVEGAEPSYCIRNFRAAAGLADAPFGGKVFQDSDVAKWLEAVSYTLMWHPDPELEKLADETIELIAAAQQPDGYLDTYYILNGLSDRFTNLRDNHELYCAGHMIEAAVAYYRATGKRRLLEVVMRLADYLDTVFGTEEGKIPGYPGHEVIEMALFGLFRVTGVEKYKRLALYFLDQRGQEPNYFGTEHQNVPRRWLSYTMGYAYNQSHLPVRRQTEAVGHSVRAMYLYAGMADAAREENDEEMLLALRALWKNMAYRRSYITGAVGSSHWGESFTFDYDLPNDTVYGETCAAIGSVFWARRMLELEPAGEYADVMERALYNGILSGMSLDGEHFFYVNPLEVLPEASEKDESKRHVRPERQKWFSTACCPPNLARLVASLPDYIYGTADDTLFVHLYAGSTVNTEVNGRPVSVRTVTGYPWKNRVSISVSTEEPLAFTLALRIPGWCRNYRVCLGSEELRGEQKNGYLYLARTWRDGDEICFTMDMPAERVYAHPLVRADNGKTAVRRGPVVYCLEEADNGQQLNRLVLERGEELKVREEPGLLGGVVTVEAAVLREKDAGGGSLYRTEAPSYEKVPVTFIPYYAWANRGAGEMSVWIREKE